MLGDLINTTGTVHAICQAFRNSEIAIECGTSGGELFEGLPVQVHIRKRHPGLFGRFKRIAEYRKRRYDLAIILDDSHEKARLLRAGGAKVIVGCHKGKPQLFDNSVEFNPNGHDLFETLEGILGLLGIEGDVQPILPASFIIPGQRQGIGFYIGSSDVKKSWPTESWIELAKLLPSELGRPIVFGGPDDVRDVHQLANAVGVVVPPPSTSLKELANHLSRLQALVVADTGPAHLSVALSTPTIVLYGPTDPSRFHPYGTEHRVLRENTDCEHYGHGCAHLINGQCSRLCMTSISPQSVALALHNLLT